MAEENRSGSSPRSRLLPRDREHLEGILRSSARCDAHHSLMTVVTTVARCPDFAEGHAAPCGPGHYLTEKDNATARNFVRGRVDAPVSPT
jgi:hypothetical protein